MSKMPKDGYATFWLGIGLFVAGWVFFGLGVVLFPLSLFFIMRSNCSSPLLALLVISTVVGFMLSLYFTSQYIAQHLL